MRVALRYSLAVEYSLLNQVVPTPTGMDAQVNVISSNE